MVPHTYSELGNFIKDLEEWHEIWILNMVGCWQRQCQHGSIRGLAKEVYISSGLRRPMGTLT